MRAIGKGHSATIKFLSIMNMGKPLAVRIWSGYSVKLAEKIELIAERNMSHAVASYSTTITDEATEKSPVSTPVSFDCSWNSSGWQTK